MIVSLVHLGQVLRIELAGLQVISHHVWGVVTMALGAGRLDLVEVLHTLPSKPMVSLGGHLFTPLAAITLGSAHAGSSLRAFG